MNPNIKRVGEPQQVRGVSSAYETQSLPMPKNYEIETTPLPGSLISDSWCKYFLSQLSGNPFLAYHDGHAKIYVQCNPDEHPDWLEHVDATITKTNEYVEPFRTHPRLNK